MYFLNLYSDYVLPSICIFRLSLNAPSFRCIFVRDAGPGVQIWERDSVYFWRTKYFLARRHYKQHINELASACFMTICLYYMQFIALHYLLMYCCFWSDSPDWLFSSLLCRGENEIWLPIQGVSLSLIVDFQWSRYSAHWWWPCTALTKTHQERFTAVWSKWKALKPI